jgi:hypothetical protein
MGYRKLLRKETFGLVWAGSGDKRDLRGLLDK